MGEKVYDDLHIYTEYRRYMREVYGPGPWCPLTYPYMDPDDEFLVWRARHFPNWKGKYAGWSEVYREQVFFFKRGTLRKGRSSRRGRRRKWQPVKRAYVRPSTLA